MRLLLVSAMLLAASACNNKSQTTQGNASARGLTASATAEVPVATLVPAEFCPTKKSFSLANARWLGRLSKLEYKHYSEAGPEFEEMGFGLPGDGKRFKKYWYIHRIKLIEEKDKTDDDTWFGESARLERLQFVKDELKKEFGIDYVDDGKKAADFENSFIQKMDDSRIQMISALTSSKLIAGSSTQFMYAEHAKDNYSVIAFRGTEKERFADILTDINIGVTPLEGMGKIHKGFYNALADVEPELMAFLTKRTQSAPLNLWITGHSLGGALGQLLTAKLLLLKEQGLFPNLNIMGMYSFGAPRLGDPDFARAFDKLAQQKGVTVVRFRNHTDPVSDVPGGPLKIGDFMHAGSLAYFDANGALYHKDGWVEIESKSDLRTVATPEVSDHKMDAYRALIQKAYDANVGTELISCDLLPVNAPPIPFYEDKTLRD